jgi:hypothetical protein
MGASWRRSIVGVLILVVAGAPLPCAAQSSLPVTVDQRVRLWTDAADAVVGRVAAATPQSIEIAGSGGEPIAIAAAAVRRVEISRGRTSKGQGFKKGALWGAVILASIGAVSSALQHDAIGDDGATVTEAALLGIWSGGLFGGLIGGGIGAARSGDRWEQVWP